MDEVDVMVVADEVDVVVVVDVVEVVVVAEVEVVVVVVVVVVDALFIEGWGDDEDELEERPTKTPIKRPSPKNNKRSTMITTIAPRPSPTHVR